MANALMPKTIVEQMESSGIFMKAEYTNNEYTDELLRFQKLVGEIVCGDQASEDIRLNAIIVQMENAARAKGLGWDARVQDGIRALRNIEREISVSVSGRNSESRAARVLNFCTRNDLQSYRNVYVSDGESETELDNVLLTKNGIIILEVKSVKGDVKISEDGHIMRANDEYYDDKPIDEKMNIKCRLLKNRLEALMAKHGVQLPIRIDSYVVFSTPKNVYIHVNDLYRKQKYCSKGKLKYIVDDFTSDICYAPDEFVYLQNLLGEIETSQKRFSLAMDFDEVRESFAQAYCLIFAPESSEAHSENSNQATPKSFWSNLIRATTAAKDAFLASMKAA